MAFSRRIIVTVAASAAAAAAVAGGAAIASSDGGSSATTPYRGPAASSSSGPSVASGTVARLHTLTTSVEGTSRRILVDAKGDPLYYFAPDTATRSRVAGQLAALWPPVVGSAAAVQGAPGEVTTVTTANGRQVAYNGHFLYSFVQDHPGEVTGQGVQEFFVATPELPPLSSSARTPPSTSSGSGY